ncbi:GNAT family N-acetyltransferase [Allopusillimonas soli]|uniref:GNAT family N-acetyltransferase n=1 Tax=Allopusillimonas soli TaxID=659016 RepID=A0A853FH55_9BURK|nr:GNAT family N-acetyltransferase [Allopusillimonas soli]NYT38130.1 GNAT family N-acetyltransferase [Allopusillimonas soli]TEA74007.1 GNAT family N-acetyltransferase [Allopusillimonas soli]
MVRHIQPVTEADHDAWLPLWHGYQAFYKVDISPRATEAAWARFLDETEPMHAALLREDGRAIGVVHWIYHRSTWTEGNYCYLQDLFVAPDSRKGGAGTALIRFVYDHASREGASRVYWLTHKTNETGISLYRKVADESGFIQFRHAL